MFSRPTYSKTMALRHPQQTRALAMAGCEGGKAIPEVGVAISVFLGQLGHLRVAAPNREPPCSSRSPIHHKASRRRHAGGIKITIGLIHSRSKAGCLAWFCSRASGVRDRRTPDYATRQWSPGKVLPLRL